MRVSTKLKSISYVLVTTLIVLLSSIIWLLIITRSENRDLRLFDEIQTNFHERTSLRDQYFLYHEELIRIRWEENKQHSDSLLRQARLQLRDKESLENIEALVRNIDETAVIFHRIVANSNALKLADSNRKILEEMDKRLSSQLLLKASLIRDATFSLKNSAVKSVQQRYRQLTVTILVLAGSLLIGIIYWNILLKQEVKSQTIHLENEIAERKRYEQELQAKNTEMERFAYTVSHDLKSPLITIQGFAGMIVRNMEAGRYERALDDIKRIEGVAGKMTELLNALLELSRAGKMVGEPSRIDMNRLVKGVLAQLAGTINQSQIEVIVESDLPSVLGDLKRIAEVLQNLIENSVKYRGDQAVLSIEVGAWQEGEECVFFVSDNGKGIDPAHHERIFGLFNKLDANSEGTGVGLALVKRIIEAHGGRVWVESEGVGMGSRFCFTVGGL